MEHSLDFCYKGEKRKLLINSRIKLTKFVGCYKDKSALWKCLVYNELLKWNSKDWWAKKNLRWWVEKKYKDQFRLKKNYKVHFIDRHDGLKGELDIYKKAIV